MTIQVKKLSEDAILPKFIRDGDAAMDLYSNEDVVLEPGQRLAVKTGIALAIPEGHAGLIWDRSGLAARNGITTMGGVIDSNYRGEIGIILQNHSSEPLQVEKGMRIAQMLIQKVEQRELVEVESLDETHRGDAGFGSSGLH